VLVPDTERVEKRAHHRPLRGKVIQHEHPGDELLGQIWHAGEVTRLAIVVESAHRLGPELHLLGDEQCGLLLLAGRFVGVPEGGRGTTPLLRGHLLPQARRRQRHPVNLRE
jgi:hypothetical protein